MARARGMPSVRAICLGVLPAARRACARDFRSSLFIATSLCGTGGTSKTWRCRRGLMLGIASAAVVAGAGPGLVDASPPGPGQMKAAGPGDVGDQFREQASDLADGQAGSGPADRWSVARVRARR